MKLTSLIVENFKQFERVEVAFAPGFTVIKGPNEAGKSSIQAAILASLFLDPSAPDDALEDYIRWGQTNKFRLRLEFEAGDATYHLSKDFQVGATSLSWTQAQDGLTGSTSDTAGALAIVGDLLGSNSMETYMNTACIRGDEVSKLPSSNAPVSQRLQAKVAGGRQASATQVLETISQELASMTTSNPRKLHDTGVLRVTRERIEALQRNRSLVAAKLAAHLENTRQLLRLRDELANAEVEIAKVMEGLEMSDRAQSLEEDCALLEEYRLELQRAPGLRDSVGQAAEELSGLDHKSATNALDYAKELEHQLNQQRHREAEINRQLAVLVLNQMQNSTSTTSMAALLGGSILAAVCASIAVILQMVYVAPGILVGLGILGYGLKSRRTVRFDSSRSYSDELNRCGEKIRSAQHDLNKLLSTYGLHSVEELESVVEELQPSGEARAARQQRIARILGARRTETRQAELERVTQEIEVRRSDLIALAPQRLSVEEYEHIDHEAQAQRSKRDNLLREMYRLEGELRADDVNSEMLACIDEDLVGEQVRLARLERRRKALEHAASGMREALAATLAQASSVFRTGVTKHLGPITGGRYDQVDARIDENGLHLMVYTTDKHRAVRADSLSRATQDQIYLAARMALLELVCEGRRPPLLLDDPFVNYDDKRVENTISLLRDLYANHQVVLFTCTDRYDQFADTLITLKGPKVIQQHLTKAVAS